MIGLETFDFKRLQRFLTDYVIAVRTLFVLKLPIIVSKCCNAILYSRVVIWLIDPPSAEIRKDIKGFQKLKVFPNLIQENQVETWLEGKQRCAWVCMVCVCGGGGCRKTYKHFLKRQNYTHLNRCHMSTSSNRRTYSHCNW